MRGEGERGGEKGAREPNGGGTVGSATVTSRAEIRGRSNTFTLVGCPRGERKKRAISCTKPNAVGLASTRAASPRAPYEPRRARPLWAWGRRGGATALLLDLIDRIPSAVMTEKPVNLIEIPTYSKDAPGERKPLYNQRKKYYRDADGILHLAEICTFSRPKFNPHRVGIYEGETYSQFMAKYDKMIYEKYVGLVREYVFDDSEEKEQKPNKCSLQALNRAKKRAFDLMACNPDMNMFCTLTLDGSKISRTEYSEIIKKLNVWLDNCVRRRGLKYVLVPEYHADGTAIHFHGLMNENALDIVNSGVKHSGKVVYNIANWKYGFTTAKRVGKSEKDHTSVCKYIFKYMTKSAAILRENPDADCRIGGRYFFHGGKLAEPEYEYINTPFDTARGYEVNICDGLKCKVENFV